MKDALYQCKADSVSTGIYKKIMAGNVPIESHYLALHHLFAAVFDEQMYSLRSRTLSLMCDTSYYPSELDEHWTCVSFADIMVPKSYLHTLDDDMLIMTMDTYFQQKSSSLDLPSREI